LNFERVGTNLVLQVGSTNITVRDHYSGSGVENIIFSNGATVYGYTLNNAGYGLSTDATNPLQQPGNSQDMIASANVGEQLDGNGGNDLLFGNGGVDTINGGLGNDLIVGGAGNDTLNGGAGTDTYVFGLADGLDTINDTDIDTIFIASGGAELVGIDMLDTNTAFDLGNININFNGQQVSIANFFVGTNGMNVNFDNATFVGYSFGTSNYLISQDEADPMNGTAGNDIIVGVTAADQMFGGTGNDLLFGGGASSGFDLLDGGAGNDLLVGGAQVDQLVGGADSDVLIGGAGADQLTGGTGADSFVFVSNADSTAGLGRDTIADFTRGSDLIDLSALNASKFVGTALFSDQAGQVRYATFDGATIVELDSNGDRIADFQVELAGQMALGFADFKGLEIDGTAKGGGGKKAFFSPVSSEPDGGSHGGGSLDHHPQDYLLV
jgi:Ca2+-binding RTX toxin-like protein